MSIRIPPMLKRCGLRRRFIDVQGSGELGVYGGVERGYGADAGASIFSVSVRLTSGLPWSQDIPDAVKAFYNKQKPNFGPLASKL